MNPDQCAPYYGPRDGRLATSCTNLSSSHTGIAAILQETTAKFKVPLIPMASALELS